MKRRLAAVLALTCLTAPLPAADPPRQQTVWHLSSFLQGTTPQVRDTVNGQLEGLLGRKTEKLAERDKLKADMDGRLSAVGKLAGAAPEKDPQIAADKKQLDDLQSQLRQMEPAIANAVKARDQLIDGLRATLKLPGPPKDGAKGILGRIKPTRIVDATSLLCSFDAIEITGADDHPKNLPDGMKGMKGKLYKIQLLVTGIDTTPMRGKSEVTLDGRFELSGTQQIGRQKVFVAKPSADKLPIDELLTALDDLHTPPATGNRP